MFGPSPFGKGGDTGCGGGAVVESICARGVSHRFGWVGVGVDGGHAGGLMFACLPDIMVFFIQELFAGKKVHSGRHFGQEKRNTFNTLKTSGGCRFFSCF